MFARFGLGLVTLSFASLALGTHVLGVGVAVVGVITAAAPAHACNPHVTMGQVDQALASARLKSSQLADANALRDYMAEAVQKNDQRRAHHLETQVMQLMGYVEDRPVSRSAGCDRVWKKAG